jgi:hypothetical protein
VAFEEGKLVILLDESSVHQLMIFGKLGLFVSSAMTHLNCSENAQIEYRRRLYGLMVYMVF